MPGLQFPTMEFHISRRSRDLYQFDETLYASSGNVIFANFHAARSFAQKINQKRDLVRFPEQAVRAGQINAMGLLDEILHLVVGIFRRQQNPQVMQDALDWLYGMLGQEVVDDTLRSFAEEFPPLAVYRREVSLDEYLSSASNGVPNRQLVLEEMLMLWLANANPALAPYLELFDDSLLEKESAYTKIMALLHAFLDTQPTFGPDEQNLIDMLRAPAIAVPHSLTGQLEYIRQRWGYLLGRYLYRLLSSLDLIKEEEKTFFMGPGPARVYEFGGLEFELERFSEDKDWMPRLVLIAKNTYVWLDQLSKKYQRAIYRLDQIPEEELDQLARWGFTGLWLIGLWERSLASRKIKQLRGNPDAVASAYSLMNYEIAGDLGGEEAYQELSRRSWQHGIRLASDMVPNHMGIDSHWVIEHPDWFIGQDYSPFPSYTFSGTNLSWDANIGIYLEDHYYDNSDAAVVFKRVDHRNGSTSFIYHGNDGTSMPWNDTAQLNYLLPEVREAVIQTILSVARKFRVIRFDAAMTLAKKHYQRLWFPEPGGGGDIPSRAEHSLTKDQFEAAFPVEFWREVVDRVAQELPDTLLLAEAFWLMEGYFVRTLGMHRVYNSAFMNMLRDEKNAEYRLVIKNTLEFDPEILKRYVNFMNNPDERTAVDQFGKGDKYFGICALMATMPGLPMFGHGQIEGFSEKYGMEFRKAYWEEQPDPYLVERHQREIFPLLRRRYLFAEVRNFLLYDFYSSEGYVNEDVFAYSNQSGEEFALVVYQNKYASTSGWIRTSSAYSIKNDLGERVLQQRSLGDGMGLKDEPGYFCIFRDHVNGLEYIRSNSEIHEKGIYLALDAYNYKIFLDFRQVQDNDWRQYAHLTEYLNGRGVPSIEEALKEIFLQPIHYPFRELVNAGMFRWIITNRLNPEALDFSNVPPVLDEAEEKYARILYEVKRVLQGSSDEPALTGAFRDELKAAMQLAVLDRQIPADSPGDLKAIQRYIDDQKRLSRGDASVWGTLLGWLTLHRLGEISSPQENAGLSRSWIDELLLGRMVQGALVDMGLDDSTAWRSLNLIKLLTTHQDWWRAGVAGGSSQNEQKTNAAHSTGSTILRNWLRDEELQNFLGIHRYQDVLWYNKEAFEEMLWWMFVVGVVQIVADYDQQDREAPESGNALPGAADALLTCYEIIARFILAEKDSEYKIEKLLDAVK